MATISTNAAVNQIANTLTGLNQELNTNAALNLIAETIFNASNGYIPGLITEDFIYAGGSEILINGGNANGGNTINVSATPFLSAANLNGSTSLQRAGLHQINISNASANAMASVFNATGITGKRYTLLSTGSLYFDAVWRQFQTAIINFANDPVLACVGYFDVIATSNVNPVTGVYFRMPRLSETQFIKYVVREASTETVFSTSVPVSTNPTGFFKVGMMWNGMTDTMTFYATDGVIYSENSITTFSVSYPTVINLNLHLGVYIGRNGDGTSKQQTGIQLDSLSRWVNNNYNTF